MSFDFLSQIPAPPKSSRRLSALPKEIDVLADGPGRLPDGEKGVRRGLHAVIAHQSAIQSGNADYPLTTPFAVGLARLRTLVVSPGARSFAAVWWRCHRRIIVDYLLAAGEQEFHIRGPSQVEDAQLTLGAVVRDDGAVTVAATQPPIRNVATVPITARP